MLAVLTALAAPVAPKGEDPRAVEVREVEAWRAKRLERLTSESGWLTLVGLYWLHDGENRFGTDAANDVVLPAGTAPARAGSFRLASGRVRVTAPAEAGVTIAGTKGTDREVRTDAEGAPDEIKVGRLTLTVIKRGDRIGIPRQGPGEPGPHRVPRSCRTRSVRSIGSRRSSSYETPKEIKIPTVLGTTETLTAPGSVRFVLQGQELTLMPVLEEPDAKELFFIFRDRTSGKETYEAGRFLYSELPKNGKVTIDFNRAYNPPCAFTPYATCPLPPRDNWLAVPIEAGEKKYAAGHP